MLVRVVPIRGGKPFRFGFMNLWLDAPPDPQIHPDLWGPGKAAQARVESTGTQVVVRPVKATRSGYIAVNGERIHDPTPLAHGDIIALGDNDGAESVWEFEQDLRLTKATRLETEAGRGLHRGPPDTLVFEGQHVSDKHDFQVAVDAAGITVSEKGHRLFRASRSMSVPWDELDAVSFASIGSTKYVQTSGDVGREILVGIQVGLRSMDELMARRSRDEAASDVDRAFLAPAYIVSLMRRKKHLRGEGVILERAQCALLAQAIEYFAPIDLVW